MHKFSNYTKFGIGSYKIKMNLRISREIYKNAFSLFFSRLIGVLLNVIGISIIAQFGHDILAASALAFIIFASFGMLIYGIMYGVGIIVGKVYGEKNYLLVGQLIRHGAILAIILALISILILWNISSALTFFHQEQTVIQPTQELLRSFILRYLPMTLFVLFNQYVIGVDKPKIIGFCGLVNALLTIPLSYILTYGRFGFPNLNIWGVGIANFIGATAQFSLIFVYTLTNRHFKKFHLISYKSGKSGKSGKTCKNKYPIVDILRLGFPIGLLQIIEISALGLSSFMFGLFSTNALAAQQISFQFTSLLLLIPTAIAESVSILIGQSFGRKDKKAINQYTYVASFLGIILVIVIGSIICIFPKFFIKFYIDSKNYHNIDLMHTTISFLIISMITQLFDGIRNILTGTLRGIFDIRIPLLINIVIFWFFALPISYLFSFLFHFGPIGVKYGWLIAMIIGSLILYIRYYLLYSKLKFNEYH